MNHLPDSWPDSWFEADLTEVDITEDDEARQILLLELQSKPEICPNVLAEQVLMSRDAAHIQPLLGGIRGISIAMLPYTPAETEWVAESRINPDMAAETLNMLAKPYRKRLALMVDEQEERSRQETALLLAANDDGEFANSEAKARAMEFVDSMRLAQAEATAALFLGEL